MSERNRQTGSRKRELSEGEKYRAGYISLIPRMRIELFNLVRFEPRLESRVCSELSTNPDFGEALRFVEFCLENEGGRYYEWAIQFRDRLYEGIRRYQSGNTYFLKRKDDDEEDEEEREQEEREERIEEPGEED